MTFLNMIFILFQLYFHFVFHKHVIKIEIKDYITEMQPPVAIIPRFSGRLYAH